MENNNPVKNTRKDYYDAVNEMGKKEFTFLKMQEYGFWPEGLPTRATAYGIHLRPITEKA